MFIFSTSLTYDVIIMMIIIVIDHYSQYCNCYMLIIIITLLVFAP